MVLTKVYQKRLYEDLHENMGYLGAERVTELGRERFYWPFLRADITHYDAKICHCLKQRKPPTHVNAPLQPILSTVPFQLVSMDYVHLEPSSGGYQYILIIMDHYTRFAQAYATRDKSAKTAADKLFNDFIMRFGFPETMHHDQDGEFENKLFYSLEKLRRGQTFTEHILPPTGERTSRKVQPNAPSNVKSPVRETENPLA